MIRLEMWLEDCIFRLLDLLFLLPVLVMEHIDNRPLQALLFIPAFIITMCTTFPIFAVPVVVVGMAYAAVSTING